MVLLRPASTIRSLSIYRELASYWALGNAPDTAHRIPIGKANVVRERTDVTVVSYSRMMVEAINALGATDQAGISVELIDLRSISPWDRQTILRSAEKTGRILIIHEAVTQFGVGAEIACSISESLFGKLKKPVKRLGAPYSPVPFAKPLETAYMPNAASIADAIKSLAAND